MRKTRRLRLIATMLICVLINTILPVMSSADVLVDTAKPTTLKLTYQYGSDTLRGVNAKVYRVADMTENVGFKFNGDFTKYQGVIDLNNMTSQDKWKAAAQTLSAYVAADKIVALETKQSDQTGSVLFDKVKTTGLYLVLSDNFASGSYTYTFSPFLIALPNKQASATSWTYDVVAYPKSDRTGGGGGGGGNPPPPPTPPVPPVIKLDYKAVKNWLDAGEESQRPQSITIEVLKNGQTYATQVLSNDNNWTFSWQADNDNSVWQVVERNVKPFYTVTSVQNGNSFVLTNTYTKEIIDEDPPESGIKKTSTPVEEIDDQPVPKSNALPQTGQLWWPVPWLASIGMLLFAVGWSMTRRG